MLYKPSQGIFKDNCVFFHDGTYYLFSMYSTIAGSHDDRRDYNHVWLATSADGVHWRDVGPVISAPFIVYAMGVWQVGGKFYLNHGSFTAPGKQNVLRFWGSEDLRNWTYQGEETDLRPDVRWSRSRQPLRLHGCDLGGRARGDAILRRSFRTGRLVAFRRRCTLGRPASRNLRVG